MLNLEWTHGGATEAPKFNNVSYILSYNKEVTFEGGNPHSDFKSIFSSYGYNSIYRTNTIMREGYIIELFKLNK